MRLDGIRLGLTLGMVMGVLHLSWAALVASGRAGFVLDYLLSLHSLRAPIEITAFEPSRAVLLVVVAYAAGFVLGLLTALVWNRAVGAKATAR